jgi:hypothetical protein
MLNVAEVKPHAMPHRFGEVLLLIVRTSALGYAPNGQTRCVVGVAVAEITRQLSRGLDDIEDFPLPVQFTLKRLSIGPLARFVEMGENDPQKTMLGGWDRLVRRCWNQLRLGL